MNSGSQAPGSMGRKKSLDSKSPKKRKDAQQGTIGPAFAKAKAAPKSLPLEVVQSTAKTVDNYNAQNIRNALEHHHHEVVNRRRYVPDATPEKIVQGRTRRRTQYNDDEDDDDDDHDLLATQILDPSERDMNIGDEDGARFLDQLQQLTSPSTAPTLEQMNCIISIVRAHGLHGRRDLSLKAFCLLQQLANLHPSICLCQHESENGSPGVSYVRVNPDAWSLTDCAGSFNLDPFEPEPPLCRVTPFNILAHLVTTAHSVVTPAKRPQEGRRSIAQTSGDLLLLKWVLSELQRDLRCRLAVYAAGSEAQGSRRTALLQNSQLWRTFSDSALKTSVTERKALVRQLIDIIAAPAELEILPPAGSLEELAFNPAELAELATSLLTMLLELYGTAEDEGMFLRHSINRTSTTGGLEHVRMALEAAMVEALVGSTQVQALATLSQKRAFLTALPYKDRLRLLAILVAKGHAKRKTDGEKYPSLEQLNHLFNNHGDVGSYIKVDPAEALRYIQDDLQGTSLALNLMDRTADGLSLLVSQMVQAATNVLPGEELASVEIGLKGVTEALIKGAHKGSSTAKTALSPTSLVSLRMAQHSLAIAQA